MNSTDHDPTDSSSRIGKSYGADDFRHLAEALPQLIWTSEPDGTLDYISPHFGEFTGLDSDSPEYLNWSGIVHPDDLGKTLKVWSHSLKTGEVYDHELRLRAADGSYQWFSARAIPVRDGAGRIVKWYGATTNVDELKRKAREKDRFIAILGHELRNPLSAISNSYQNLVHEAIDGEQKARAFESLGRQIGHLTRLVEETLDISRLASGKFRLLTTKVELNHLVESCISDMEHKFPEDDLIVRFLPSDEKIWVKADSVRLSQCIYNLLNNSIKFTSPGGNIHLTCRYSPSTNLAEIEVKDDGVGMTPEEIARIFRPFSQGRNAGRLSREGLGLGLSITNEIMALHGGDISVSSGGKGKGSSFILNLPVTKAPGNHSDPATSPAQPDDSGAPVKILLVDDDEGVISTLKMFLELEGHSVSMATCGRTAFGALDKELPDIVFCDISLPGTIKGFDVAKRVTTNYPENQTPYIIALSGHSDALHIERCLEAGFDEHLSKPTSPEDLRKAVLRASRAQKSSQVAPKAP